VFDILGLMDDNNTGSEKELSNNLINMLLDIRLEAKSKKDFETSDKIRDKLNKLGIEIKDKKDGFEWNLKQ